MDKKSKDMDKVKKLFFDYLGSPILMHHDGVAKEYQSFKISKSQESIWFEELKQNLLHKLSRGDYSAIGKLELMGAQDVLANILIISLVGNTWVKLRFAEDLWSFTEMAVSYSVETALIKQAREKAIEIWKNLLQEATNPYVPDEVMKTVAKGRNAYDYFQDRLKSNLRKASNI